jgi:hypothetical protein
MLRPLTEPVDDFFPHNRNRHFNPDNLHGGPEIRFVRVRQTGQAVAAPRSP